MPLTLEIVTPEQLVYHAECDHVILPTKQGEVDILPGHRPLIAMLVPGEVVVGNPTANTAWKPKQPGDTEPTGNDIAIDKGFARIQGDVVSVLTEAALDVSLIDESEVEDARKRAEAALEQAKAEKLDPAEIERLESVARFSIAQQIAKARKGQR